MNFDDFYLSEAGIAPGSGKTSIDRMRTRYRARLTADIHKDIDPCSWMPENGGIYGDVNKETFDTLQNELAGDARSTKFKNKLVRGEEDIYESKIKKSTACVEPFAGKPKPDPEKEKGPEKEPEPEEIPEPVDGDVTDEGMRVAYKDHVELIKWEDKWFDDPVTRDFDLKEYGAKDILVLIPLKPVITLSNGRKVDAGQKMQDFYGDVIGFVKKEYNITSDANFSWIEKSLLFKFVEKKGGEDTGERGLVTTAPRNLVPIVAKDITAVVPADARALIPVPQNELATIGGVIKKTMNDKTITDKSWYPTQFTTRGNNPVKGYLFDISNPSMPKEIKDYLIKYRERVNERKAQLDPNAAELVGDIIFLPILEERIKDEERHDEKVKKAAKKNDGQLVGGKATGPDRYEGDGGRFGISDAEDADINVNDSIEFSSKAVYEMLDELAMLGRLAIFEETPVVGGDTTPKRSPSQADAVDAEYTTDTHGRPDSEDSTDDEENKEPSKKEEKVQKKLTEKQKKEIREGLNIVSSKTVKVQNGGKITFVECIFHTKESRESKETETGRGVSKEEPANESLSFVDLYEASQTEEEPNIDPNVRYADVASGQTKWIVGFDKKAVEYVAKVCKKSAKQVLAEGSFGPQWAKMATEAGATSTKMTSPANRYALYKNSYKDFYALKILLGGDSDMITRFKKKITPNVGGGITGHGFEKIDTTAGTGYRLTVKKGTIFIIYEKMKNSNHNGKVEVWFRGPVSVDDTLCRQALSILAGHNKEDTNMLSRYYTLSDKDSKSFMFVSPFDIKEMGISDNEPTTDDDQRIEDNIESEIKNNITDSDTNKKILLKLVAKGTSSLSDSDKRNIANYKNTKSNNAKILKIIEIAFKVGDMVDSEKAGVGDTGDDTGLKQPEPKKEPEPQEKQPEPQGTGGDVEQPKEPEPQAGDEEPSADDDETDTGDGETPIEVGENEIRNSDVLVSPRQDGKIWLYIKGQLVKQFGIDPKKDIDKTSKAVKLAGVQYWVIPLGRSWDDVMSGEKEIQDVELYKNDSLKKIMKTQLDMTQQLVSYKENVFLLLVPENAEPTNESSDFAKFREAMLEQLKNGDMV